MSASGDIQKNLHFLSQACNTFKPIISAELDDDHIHLVCNQSRDLLIQFLDSQLLVSDSNDFKGVFQEHYGTYLGGGKYRKNDGSISDFLQGIAVPGDISTNDDLIKCLGGRSAAFKTIDENLYGYNDGRWTWNIRRVTDDDEAPSYRITKKDSDGTLYQYINKDHSAALYIPPYYVDNGLIFVNSGGCLVLNCPMAGL